MFFKTESGEVDTRAEHLGFSENTDTSDTVDFHLHVWVAIGIPQIGQMGSPRGILRISLDDDRVFI